MLQETQKWEDIILKQEVIQKYDKMSTDIL